MKLFKIMLLIIFSFICFGCYDNKELNEIGIVTMMLTKYEDNKYTTYVEVLNPKKEAEESSYFISGIGKTMEESVDNAEEDAQAILRDARQRAQKNEEQIVSEAKEEAARIIAHAKTEAELEKQKAADDIKKEIISVATVMAGKFIAVSVDEATQERLLEETLREIGDSTWQS